MKDILKIIKSLEDSGFLIKGVSEAIRYFRYISNLGTLGASLLGNMLTGRGVKRGRWL